MNLTKMEPVLGGEKDDKPKQEWSDRQIEQDRLRNEAQAKALKKWLDENPEPPQAK